MEHRYQATPLQEHRFPALSFYALLPPNRVEFVRTQLEHESGPINTDMSPVTYYLNMLLWGKFTASAAVDWLEKLRQLGAWPYWVPLVVLALLMILRSTLEGIQPARLRRHGATLILFVLGLVAMAAQLALLFSYQAHVGFMFSRIALLNGVFMTGLALGSGTIGRRFAQGAMPARTLVILMLMVAGYLFGLPYGLDLLPNLPQTSREGVFLALCAFTGLFTGIGFPLGIRLAQADTRNVLQSSGLIEAADNFGGALGGMLTGSILVPVLGVATTCYLLAVLAVLALLPLAYAEVAPAGTPQFRERSYRAFPYPTLSWALAAGVLTIALWSWLGRTEAPPPRVYFDETVLAEISGSRRFELRETPWPYYLGFDQDIPSMPQTTTTHQGSPEQTQAADTVTLASATNTANIHGYAGPINLLVALDRTGKLRGVRYLDSHETPSYIEPIDQWLAGLSGFDLSEQPLNLERVDGMSGATVTSRAALEIINQAARAGARHAFGAPVVSITLEASEEPARWSSPSLWITFFLLLAFFPVYHSGRDGLRLLYQGAVLIFLGFAFNSLVTEIHLFNLGFGHLPSLASHLQWYLLVGFVMVTALLFGPVYCGYVCPFGALQEFISRLGRRFYLRRYAVRELDMRLRYVKFVLLALVIMLTLATGDLLWASFNPMQHFFHANWSGWLGLISGISLVGALFYYRFWCRYFCPFGAFLALSNKIALAKHWIPQRRFNYCDLGVRHEYDVDCLCCHRCLSAQDFGVRHRPRRSLARTAHHAP